MDNDQLGGRSAGQVVQRVSHYFLAGTRFALDKNGGTSRGDLLNEFRHRLHGRGFADEPIELVGLLDLAGELAVFRLQAAAAQGAFEQHLHLVKVEWLGHKEPSPAPHGLHSRVHRAVGGHHDSHRRLGQGQRRS